MILEGFGAILEGFRDVFEGFGPILEEFDMILEGPGSSLEVFGPLRTKRGSHARGSFLIRNDAGHLVPVERAAF